MVHCMRNNQAAHQSLPHWRKKWHHTHNRMPQPTLSCNHQLQPPVATDTELKLPVATSTQFKPPVAMDTQLQPPAATNAQLQPPVATHTPLQPERGHVFLRIQSRTIDDVIAITDLHDFHFSLCHQIQSQTSLHRYLLRDSWCGRGGDIHSERQRLLDLALLPCD